MSRATKKTAAPADAKKTLRVPVTSHDPVEIEKQAAAWTLLPSVKAGMTIAYWRPVQFKEAGINEVVEELSAQGAKAADGDFRRLECMLAIQAHTLDSMFNELAALAHRNLTVNFGAAETFMRLALKAQSQCRATVESLAIVKNPPGVAFVKQANIAAGHQQVNNGTPARGNPFQSNEVLEAHERLEQRAPQAAGIGDSTLATLGAIDRPKVEARQGQSKSERTKARGKIA